MPFPPPADLPDPVIEPASPALAGRFFTSEPLEKPKIYAMTKREKEGIVTDLKKLKRPITTVWITNKLWKILRKMRIPHHLTCLLRNLYAGQEVTVRAGHGTMDCLYNLYAGSSCKMLGWMNHKLESRLPGEISIRYADDTTLTAESKELKSLLIKVRGE